MTHAARYIIFLLLLPCFSVLQAQKLTGCWQGEMQDEFIEINIIQQNDAVCGYTYDYLFTNPRDHCKAYFNGYYNKNKAAWFLTGTSFIENSGTHVLMQITLIHEKGTSSNILKATVAIKSVFGQFFSLGGIDTIELKRVSGKPGLLPNKMPTCFTEIKKTEPPQLRKTIPAEKIQPVQKPVPAKRPDTLYKTVDSIKKRITPPLVIIQRETVPPSKELVTRKNTVFSRIPVDTRSINLKVYDNGEVDGDTVTIFYNGRVLVNKQMLSEKPIVIDLELDKDQPLHQITLFANNLGSIPPNTALIVVTAGDKRYELHAKSNLQENAVLVFEYTGKSP